MNAVIRNAGSMICLLLWVSTASACPFCESEIGKQVNAGVFDEDFWVNVVLTLLPFPILLLIVTFLHLGFPWLRTSTPPLADATTHPVSSPGE